MIGSSNNLPSPSDPPSRRISVVLASQVTVVCDSAVWFLDSKRIQQQCIFQVSQTSKDQHLIARHGLISVTYGSDKEVRGLLFGMVI